METNALISNSLFHTEDIAWDGSDIYCFDIYVSNAKISSFKNKIQICFNIKRSSMKSQVFGNPSIIAYLTIACPHIHSSLYIRMAIYKEITFVNVTSVDENTE